MFLDITEQIRETGQKSNMPLSKKTKTHQRATAAQMQKYGRNLRKNLIDSAPIRQRLQLLCDIVFSGNKHEMAHASGVCYRQLYRILYGHSRLTIQVAAQIVSRLGIRAEWLLVGSGSLFPTGDDVECFAHVPRLLTQYKHFDTLRAATVMPAPRKKQKNLLANFNNFSADISAAYSAASLAVYQARLVQKPVCLFLDEKAVTSDMTVVWRDMCRVGHVTLLYVTLAALFAEIGDLRLTRPLDLNSFAILAARLNAGYGETLCRHCRDKLPEEDIQKLNASTFMSAYTCGLAVLCSSEIGEIPIHTNPTVRAPELGAAVGAASYADLLSFTEIMPAFFGGTGGVVICPANFLRIARVFLSRVPSLSLVSSCSAAGVTFIVFLSGDQPDSDTIESLNSIIALGGNVVLLPELNTESALTFFSACQRRYAGANFLTLDGSTNDEQ